MTGFPHSRRLGALTLALAFALPAFQANAQGHREGPASRTQDAPPPPPSGAPSAGGAPSKSMEPGGFMPSQGPARGGDSGQQGPGMTGRSPRVDPSGIRPNPGPPRGAGIIAPRPMVRRMVDPPDHTYWRLRHRDIMREIQWMARSGFIAIRPIADDMNEYTDFSEYPAGWRGYGFAVPPGEKIHIRLRHPSEGWFSLRMMNKWGQLEPGMLQNLIPTGNPEVSYKNLTNKAKAVYMLVDDPGWMSTKDNPYKLVITRSWDPKLKKDTSLVPLADGVWAVNKEEAKPKADAPKGIEATKG